MSLLCGIGKSGKGRKCQPATAIPAAQWLFYVEPKDESAFGSVEFANQVDG